MTATDTHVLLRAFCDELARCGVSHACTSPGSRSAPLVLALVREERVRCWSHLDERCAAFFALGLAKASGRPVALACTSGTAAANFAPAVIEAHEARVPLIVLTADRPPELRDVGAGQTIDQLTLYGSAAKWFFEVGTHEASEERLCWIRRLACRAVWTAEDDRPGPVHLNFALREPLVLEEPLPGDATGRSGGEPWVHRRRRSGAQSADLAPLLSLARAPRGVVVAGRYERNPDFGPSAAALAARLGWPLLADPLSGARRPPAGIAHYDSLLRDHTWAAAHAPQAVLRLGDLPTSKPLRAWLADQRDIEQVALDAEHAWQDPSASVSQILAGEPGPLLLAAAERIERATDLEWLTGWRQADAAAAAAIAATLADGLSEPRVAAELGARLPARATLFVASSMPVRDVETFFPARADPPRALSNRGANGIDGTVSSAFGAAAAEEGAPVVLLIGDVALAYDLGGLLAHKRLGLDITIVLLNNDGGGIFHFLPLATQADAFEEHVATPHGLDFSHAAALYGCGHRPVATLEELRDALDLALAAPDMTILEVRTTREENLALHRRVADAVSAAL